MRKSISIFALGVAMFIFPAADVFGCGDKYLSVGRGARFQRGYVSLHPVSVAVFKSQVTGSQSFLSRLKIAGHRVTVADSAAKLETMLATGKFDVVLAGFESASLVEGMIVKQSTKPTFLPVVEEGSDVAPGAAKKYGCVLNAAAGKKQKNFLAVLDDAVQARMKSLPLVCNTAAM